MAVQRHRLRDRVQAVERVRDVHDAALRADRLDRLAERHSARNLLRQEEPDHLALVGGLHLLARDHDQVPVTCQLDGLEGAAEDVVVGDGDRAEAFLLGVVEELLDRDLAVVRPVRVQVQVGGEPFAVAQRSHGAVAAARRQVGVDRVEVAGRGTEALALGALPRARLLALSVRVVLGEAQDLGRRELRLLGQARRRHDRAAGCRGLQRHAVEALKRRDEDRGLVQQRRPRLPVPQRAHV
jgi:hypothetical protein